MSGKLVTLRPFRGLALRHAGSLIIFSCTFSGQAIVVFSDFLSNKERGGKRTSSIFVTSEVNVTVVMRLCGEGEMVRSEKQHTLKKVTSALMKRCYGTYDHRERRAQFATSRSPTKNLMTF